MERVKHRDSLHDLFYSNYELKFINSEEELQTFGKLKFETYTDPNDHIQANSLDFPSGVIIDQFDPLSVHCLLIDRNNNEPIGCARLILGKELAKHNLTFPLAHYAKDSLFGGDLLFKLLSLNQTAEVSSFLLSKDKRNHGARKTLLSVVGLIMGVIHLAHREGVTFLIAAMEPKLVHLFHLYGIYFEQISPYIRYHGQVICYAVNMYVLMSNIYKVRPDVWSLITDNGKIDYYNGKSSYEQTERKVI